MALVTYPLNNIDYTAEDAELYHCTRTSGVFAAEEDYSASVTGTDNIVTIGQGIAWIRNSRFSGKVVANKEATQIDMGIADGSYPRIDAVVIRFDANNNQSNIISKQGVASSSPVAPEIVRSESIYELHLYHVRRRAGATSILSSDITDLRTDSNYCGVMSDDVTMLGDDFVQKTKIGAPGGVAPLNDSAAVPIENGGTGATTAAQARKKLGITGERIAKATSSNGISYTASIEGVDALYDGLEITIIPQRESNSTSGTNITLNLNSLGAKPMRRAREDFTGAITTGIGTGEDPSTGKAVGFMSANIPVRLVYYASRGYWILIDHGYPLAETLIGTLPISKGGTGATTAEQARANLGINNQEFLKFADNNGAYRETSNKGNSIAEVWETVTLSDYGLSTGNLSSPQQFFSNSAIIVNIQCTVVGATGYSTHVKQSSSDPFNVSYEINVQGQYGDATPKAHFYIVAVKNIS